MTDLAKSIASLSPDQRAILELRLQMRRAGVRSASAIGRRSDPGSFPLSFAQQRLWFLEELAPGSSLYVVPIAVRLYGELVPEALEAGLTGIVRRHEVLRASFTNDRGRPVQRIGPVPESTLAMIDLAAIPAPVRDAEAFRLATEESSRPVPLTGASLLRALLMRVAARDHVLVVGMNHIASDGWSVGVLLRELAALYGAALSGKPSPLPALPIQYSDFAQWQRDWLSGRVLERQLSYWRTQLAGAPAALDLPIDLPRPAVQTFRGAAEPIFLDGHLVDRLRALAQAGEATFFMVLVAGWSTLLSRYSGQSDLLLGTPVANRNRVEIECLIGFFVNTLVLRNDLAGDPDVLELLARVREQTLQAYAHQDLPFEKLVEELAPERSLAHSPLVQVMIVLQNTPLPDLRLPGLELQVLPSSSRTAKFDLTLSLEESEGGVSGALEYNTDLFTAPTIRRMCGHFQNLLRAMAAMPKGRLQALSMLGAAERRQVLLEWNDTRAEYPRGVCLHELFERQVVRTPEAVAVVAGAERLSYRDLNARANRLAHHLRRLGVGAEVPVALAVERSAELVVALLGVLKAGGAYLPVDPAYPEERRRYMLESSRAPILLTRSSVRSGLERSGAVVVDLDADRERIAAESAADPHLPVAPENLAYVLYTSGSTGRPKGAMISHAAICNHMVWMQEALPLGADDSVLQKTPFSFDASVWEFWAPLLVGARLVMARPGGHQDPAYLADQIQLHRVTTFQVVPTLLKLFLKEPGAAGCTSLRRFYCGGEALSVELAERFFETLPVAELLNVYGPTEASIHAAFWSSRREEVRRCVPIGRPIANAQVYLLDREMEPVPVGVPGLLYVGGAGLGRGYLARPEMTAAVFVPDPWSGGPGERLYLTGDLARYLPDGNVELLGRVDSQVKVRGFRIELGEIEAVLAAHPTLREAVVAIRQDASGAHRLVAYAVPREGRETQVKELRAYLKERLPEHMVPADFVLLAEFPLLPNGKLDRRALPQPESTGGRSAAGPGTLRTPIEELIAAAWSELLGVREVGEGDNFFELGGHSLLAAQVLSRLRETLGVELPLRSLFEAPTVAELARRVEAAQGAPHLALPPLVPLPREGLLPASYAQERLWFFDQLQPGNPAYNLVTSVSLTGQLDLAAFAAALYEEVRRQEALRTSFPAMDGRPALAFSLPAPLSLPLADLTALPALRRSPEMARLLGAESRRPFDLACGPLWRALVVRLGRAEHVLSLMVHHIVSDGWSTGLLVRETAELYQAFAAGKRSPLPELPLQYADYARWQRAWLTGEPLAAQLAYWTGQLAGAPVLTSLPTDRPRPAAETFRGLHRELLLSPAVVPAVAALGRRLGLTQHMILITTFAALLRRYSDQDDLCIGTPIANRNHPLVEGLIGLFVNTLVLRVRLAGEPTARELLGRVKETALEAYGHRELPLELLVEALDLRRDLSHNPLFQTMFSLQNVPLARLDLPGLRLEPLAMEPGGARFDLTVELAETGGALGGWIEYNTDLFDGATIERLKGHFSLLLAGLLDQPEARVSELPLLTEGELHQLLCGWNDTAAPFPGDAPVSRLFEATVERHLEATAVVCGEETLTYGELNRRANRLARHLRALGVGAETIVGVHLPRSAEMVVALLAIWKAGGAYLPLDPTYPADRIALMLEDSRAPVVIARQPLDGRLAGYGGTVVDLDVAANAVARWSEDDLAIAAESRNLAYVIYTSGSTGRPKGVMVPHRGVASFFTGMDARVGSGTPGVWLAVTSISFDISVLELFWSLCRGFEVVLQKEQGSLLTDLGARAREVVRGREISFSLFFFASDEEQDAGADRYRLLLEAAKFADRHGFAAVWTPERHFHAFGGLYPNPSVTGAAIAAITERIEVRAGSVVLPLHNPIRVAEEWAVVDNISRGRAGISFASGWHAVDFVLAPERFARRKEVMFEGIETVRKLWRGDEIEVPGIDGKPVKVGIRPRPVRRDLPVWVTAAGNPETFRMAGEIGANVLTHLLGQSVDELAPLIAIYRAAWRSRPERTGEGQVTLMLHAFVDADMEAVRATVRAPFRTYLKSSLSLIRNLAASLGRDLDAADFTAEDLDALLDHASDRYFETGSLFGTPASCRPMVERLRAIGVDEVACLIDFGIATDQVLASLSHLDALRASSAPERGAVLDRRAVSHLQCTPSLARMLAADAGSFAALGSVSTLMLGGEALSAELAGVLTATVQGTVHNMYGPTETTIWSATQALTAHDRQVSIGRPIANTSIYLLGRGGSAVPVGAPGELFIGGEGVVRGYLGRPDLTAERFTPDPFAALPGARLYNTGDLARFLPDGRIEFLGRTDQQVKIRGFRIEPGEIEAALELHPEVGVATVVPRRDGTDESRLVAYFVPAGESGGPAAAELRRFLADRLPDYMVPAAFVQLAALPLTPNGKIDRGALPSPDPAQPDAGRAFIAPHNPIQEMMADLWAELLGLERVGIDDSFFELGGHSLLATQLVSRLRQMLRVSLPLRAIFEAPTVALLARRLEQEQREQEGTALPPLVPAPRQVEHPLSLAQQRIWFLEQMEPGSSAYHDRAAIHLAGPLRGAALARSIAEIVRRHESLRTTFSMVSGRPFQAVSPLAKIALQVVDLSGLPAAEREAVVLAGAGALARQPFDLGSGGLLRTVLFRLGEEEHVLVLAVHHIIWDGWSLGVFLRELLLSYEAALTGRPSPLQPLSVQYIDYSQWQRQWLDDELLESHLAYWKRRLGKGGAPGWELPADRPRSAVRSNRGARLRQVLDAGLSAELRALGRRYGVTLFMTLMAGFKALMSHLTGAHDIVVGTDVANRSRVETEVMIGFFVNQLVLRTSLAGDPTFAELLARVREVSLEAYAHEDVPFDRLVDALQWDRSLAQTPLFQVKLVLQNAPIPSRGPAGLRLQPFESGWETAKFDLLLNMVDTGETIEGLWEYSTDLFDAATIAGWQAALEALLRQAAALPESRLSEIAEILTARDREQRAGKREERFQANQGKLTLAKRRALTAPVVGRGETK